MNTFDKPFKSIDELITLLESKNVTFDNVDFAKKVLGSLSYYTVVNGYKLPFISDTEKKAFVPGTKFESLYSLYIIDSNLSSILFKYILYIERYLKTRIAHVVGEHYGVYTNLKIAINPDAEDYLSVKNYSNSTRKRSPIILQLKEEIARKKKNPIFNHYMESKNHIPPWISVTNIPLGLTIEWYSIMKDAQKTIVCNNFLERYKKTSLEQKKEFLRCSLLLLKEFRNSIAHGKRTFDAKTSSKLPFPLLATLGDKIITHKEYSAGIGQNNLFAAILSILILIDDEYLIANFYRDLVSVFKPYETAKIKDKSIVEIFNIPLDFEERIKIFIEHHMLK